MLCYTQTATRPYYSSLNASSCLVFKLINIVVQKELSGDLGRLAIK